MANDYFLFSEKDMYLSISRTQGGRDMVTASLKANQRSEKVYNNRHIVAQLQFDGEYPIIQPYNGPTDFKVVPFTQRKKASGNGQIAHFFLPDHTFRKLMWEKLEKTVFELSKFDVVFAPDFSMWVDLPEFFNRESVFKNRVDTAYMQLCGIPTIPVASWGNADSFSYCFKGLPQESVIAVCGLGHLRSKACDALWHFAIREMERCLHPTLIFVYGPEVPMTDVKTPVRFIADFITKTFRKNGN